MYPKVRSHIKSLGGGPQENRRDTRALALKRGYYWWKTVHSFDGGFVTSEWNGRRIWRLLSPLAAPFALAGPTFDRRARVRFYYPRALALACTIQQWSHGPHAYI